MAKNSGLLSIILKGLPTDAAFGCAISLNRCLFKNDNAEIYNRQLQKGGIIVETKKVLIDDLAIVPTGDGSSAGDFQSINHSALSTVCPLSNVDNVSSNSDVFHICNGRPSPSSNENNGVIGDDESTFSNDIKPPSNDSPIDNTRLPFNL